VENPYFSCSGLFWLFKTWNREKRWTFKRAGCTFKLEGLKGTLQGSERQSEEEEMRKRHKRREGVTDKR
jgi:hypothetical protein